MQRARRRNSLADRGRHSEFHRHCRSSVAFKLPIPEGHQYYGRSGYRKPAPDPGDHHLPSRPVPANVHANDEHFEFFVESCGRRLKIMKREVGFTLIELMVATAIVLVILGTTLGALTSALNATQGITLMADTQENL